MVKKLLVTGASSFLGHHVVPKLNNYANLVQPGRRAGRLKVPRFEILTPTSTELNLLDADQVKAYLDEHLPDAILHMAARCGGIGANKDAPGEFIHDNMKMTANLFDGIRYVNVWGLKDQSSQPSEPVISHFYGLGTVCAYPKFCPVPFKEDDLWNGFPEETNAPYGQAKRSMLLMQQAFRQQFGLKGAHFIPVNMYGPHDHFDLRNSHVIPALIRKFIEAKKNSALRVEVWGDGSPTREFLYAKDCAAAIAKAIYTDFDYPDPINLGTGIDISIHDLAFLIKDTVGFNGDLHFTGEVSVNGQPKRCLDVSRAKEVLNFTARTELVEGLKETIDWYKDKITKKDTSTDKKCTDLPDKNTSASRNIKNIKNNADYYNKNGEVRLVKTPDEVKKQWEKACENFNEKFKVTTKRNGVFKVIKADEKHHHKKGDGFVISPSDELKDFEVFALLNERINPSINVEISNKITFFSKLRRFVSTIKLAIVIVTKAAKELVF